uniref:Tudor domain-containing protein n=1 Tax=Arcella intermedia TaxID=1963864 RepID=A0A6B2LE21_9EUKA
MVEDYKTQLDVVNKELTKDPSSEEYKTLKKSLIDLLKATKELLELKKQVLPVFDNIQELAQDRGIYIGMQCEALWKDGEWYKAIVNTVTPHGFGVTFTEYNTTEVLPPDSVRPRKKLDVVVIDTGNFCSQKPSTASIVVNAKGELVVPNTLKILSTDSEAVRRSKKKRLKHLKSHYRLNKAEEERNSRKRNWQSFQSQGKTKRVRKGPSIFQSPDSVSGKVGVTGSGKGMTEYAAQKYEPKKLSSSLPVTTTATTDDKSART